MCGCNKKRCEVGGAETRREREVCKNVWNEKKNFF